VTIDVPEIIYAVNRDHSMYGLQGWEEVDRYGMENIPAWVDATRQARALGVSEIDRLRLCVRALMISNERWRSMVGYLIEKKEAS